MPAISRVLPWFRQITGETVNQLIDAVNNLTGFGTPQAITGTTLTLSGGTIETPQLLSVNGAISPSAPAVYMITKAGVLADTLAAPTTNGIIITVASTTANAHTVTATGLFQCGTAAVNLATFAAQAGAGFTVISYNGKWVVLSSVGITFS